MEPLPSSRGGAFPRLVSDPPYKPVRGSLLQYAASFVFAALIILAAPHPVSAQSASNDSRPRMLTTIDVGLQWQPQSQFAGYYIARARDMYRQEGLDVRIHHADAERGSMDMLLDGSVDMATAFLADALVVASQGGAAQPRIVQIAQIVQRSNLMLVAWRELGIEKASDLDGRPVSYWQGSFSAAYEAFFRMQGIKPRTIPQYYTINLFLRRGVAACAAMEYNEFDRIHQAGVDDERLVLFFMRDYGFGFPEDGIYARSDWIASNRDTALAFRRATLAGWEYARTHIEETIDIVLAEAKKSGIPANRPHERWMLTHILASIFANGITVQTGGNLSAPDYRRTAEALATAGLIRKAPALDAFAPFREAIR